MFCCCSCCAVVDFFAVHECRNSLLAGLREPAGLLLLLLLLFTTTITILIALATASIATMIIIIIITTLTTSTTIIIDVALSLVYSPPSPLTIGVPENQKQASAPTVLRALGITFRGDGLDSVMGSKQKHITQRES